MQSKSDAHVVERRAQSHREIGHLVESRNDTLALLGKLASKQPFKPEHSTQLLLQNFCENLIDYTASAHFQLYRHIDENKERRIAARDIAEQIYPRIADSTQLFLDFNDKYDCEDHCDNMSELASDLSKLGELLADRIDLEDRLIAVLSAPRQA
ncbi:MAG TPA: Rsd/AlgQ family anti-sigma factor [Gammaproteobacteria bacterium]